MADRRTALTHRRIPLPAQYALGAVAAVAVVAIVVVVATSSGGHATTARRLPPPARLPPLPGVYANPQAGLVGRLPRRWKAVRGTGGVALASADGRVTITVLTRRVAPGTKPRLLSPVVNAIRQRYRQVTVKHAPGATLGGQPARSVVLYASPQPGKRSLRFLVAAAQGRHTAWVLEAITAPNASQQDLVEAQEAVLTLHLVG